MSLQLEFSLSWFRYSRCPACKRELQVVEQVPGPVIPAYTHSQLWAAESNEERQHATG